MTTILIFAAITIGIGGMIFAATMVLGGNNDQVEDRLTSLTKNGGRGSSKLEAETGSILRSPLGDEVNSIDEFVSRFMDLNAFIEQSGLNLTVAKFVGMTALWPVEPEFFVSCFARGFHSFQSRPSPQASFH